ncbi:3-deoxy-D-manno-octulosonic acid transferase [Pseudodonghicola flavimaris]|uniref:3-deoxy-D-manno-octulosonic acid transferase n=1 Tax=Pseudodonghicola flavimaris TaxID=3050036 RepID=A0ABT7EV05_9RHOB|nr:3-deoxy-D-manno-octulosonic acid transferase [Pseudodonghicola flavimaris]MDK3016170.1 3-deoxy-D-manno-octulosonic acid transferase [Pseudodonghicola flavimaris]
MAQAPMLVRLYRGLTPLLLPLAWRSVSRKLTDQGVSEARARERLGQATLPRPQGRLIWFHAASVGESLAVLQLITALGEHLPQTEFLITSGTATSAELIAKRMPPRCRHQFAPLDAPAPVCRFLDHWRPDAALLVESELWPLMIVETAARGAPLALVNARLSAKSVEGWRKWPRTAGYVLGQFALFLTQNQAAADNLLSLGADPARVVTGINLKSTSAPLAEDAATVAELAAALGGRPLWAASSTHAGEEEIILAAHRQLLERHPDLCLMLIPRHPDRGADIAAMIRATGMALARRSAGEMPGAGQQVFLADTLGELGSWYAVAPIVFMGGSLKPIGGHNPFEPADFGAALLTGPHVSNFTESYAPLFALGAAREVADAPEIATAVDDLLTRPEHLTAMRSAARSFADRRQASLDEMVATLSTALSLRPAAPAGAGPDQV